MRSNGIGYQFNINKEPFNNENNSYFCFDPAISLAFKPLKDFLENSDLIKVINNYLGFHSLIYFSSTWCNPTTSETHYVHRLHRDYDDFKFLVMTIYWNDINELNGPLEYVKNIAASFEVIDGPNSEGEMFSRPGRLSDKFVKPYPNIRAAEAANGGAYPPDMSVLVKARQGGASYIYSILLGYDDPPEDFKLDDGVYYNKYMPGHNIKMPNALSDGLIHYADGTEATVPQMAKDIATFLAWASEPSLEARHKMGFKIILYLVALALLVYLSMKKLWSRIESK